VIFRDKEGGGLALINTLSWLMGLLLYHGCSGLADQEGGASYDDTSPSTEVRADDIPVAYTPGCGWQTFPPAVLATCTEALVKDAPDLRGLWQAIKGAIKRVVQPRVFLREKGEILIQHNVEEVGAFEAFLPEMYEKEVGFDKDNR
jgi:hypothetical protein